MGKSRIFWNEPEFLDRQLHDVRFRKRQRAAQKLVEDQRQRVLVRASVLFLSFHLLRRHVSRSPGRRTPHRIQPTERLGLFLHHRRRNTGCDAEIDQKRYVSGDVLHEHDILRLHVPVNDTHPVRVIQRLGNRPENRKDPFPVQSVFMPALRQKPLPERPSVRIRHDEKITKVRIPKPSVKRTDVRVIERGRQVKYTAYFVHCACISLQLS